MARWGPIGASAPVEQPPKTRHHAIFVAGRVLMVYYTEGAGSDIRGVFLGVSAEGVEVLEKAE